MFNSYEEYMQNVLGVKSQNTYMQGMENYFEPRIQEVNMQEINNLYPDIYRIVYPMVQKACSRRNVITIDSVQLNEMVEEIYSNIEPREEMVRGEETTQKNGDVKNPRAKETRRPNNNYLLRDLIRILVIRELLQGGWQGGVMPRPPMGGPGMPGPRRTTDGFPGGPRRQNAYAKKWIYGDVLKQNRHN